MRIYIPSKQRADLVKQLTWRTLPERARSRVSVVVDNSEARAYKALGLPVLSAPDGQRIHERRQWIVDHHRKIHDTPKLLMLDDDLRFDRRFQDNPLRFEAAHGEDVMPALVQVSNMLDHYAHGGILSREGSQPFRQPPLTTFLLGRTLRAIAYDVRILQQEEVQFDRLPLLEDMDVTLQLLRRGYINCTVTSYYQGQSQSNSPGGCSTYRTPELQEECCNRLAELHAPHVKVVQRETKDGWFPGGFRADVRVRWQDAYYEGLKVRDGKSSLRGKHSPKNRDTAEEGEADE